MRLIKKDEGKKTSSVSQTEKLLSSVWFGSSDPHADGHSWNRELLLLRELPNSAGGALLEPGLTWTSHSPPAPLLDIALGVSSSPALPSGCFTHGAASLWPPLGLPLWAAGSQNPGMGQPGRDHSASAPQPLGNNPGPPNCYENLSRNLPECRMELPWCEHRDVFWVPLWEELHFRGAALDWLCFRH